MPFSVFNHQSKDFRKNEQAVGKELPCALCGLAVPTIDLWVHLAQGGAVLYTEGEARANPDLAGDMGWFPLCSKCYERYPALASYAIGGHSDKQRKVLILVRFYDEGNRIADRIARLGRQFQKLWNAGSETTEIRQKLLRELEELQRNNNIIKMFDRARFADALAAIGREEDAAKLRW